MNYKTYIIWMIKSYTNQFKSSKHQVVQQLIYHHITSHNLIPIVY